MELQIDEEKNIAYIKLSGLVTEKDILSAFDATVSSENYKKRMGRLWDLRIADLTSLSPASIERFSIYPSKFPTGINDVKVALVAVGHIELGIAQIFEIYASDSKTEVHVFEDFAKAEAWLIQ